MFDYLSKDFQLGQGGQAGEGYLLPKHAIQWKQNALLLIFLPPFFFFKSAHNPVMVKQTKILHRKVH